MLNDGPTTDDGVGIGVDVNPSTLLNVEPEAVGVGSVVVVLVYAVAVDTMVVSRLDGPQGTQKGGEGQRAAVVVVMME